MIINKYICMCGKLVYGGRKKYCCCRKIKQKQYADILKPRAMKEPETEQEKELMRVYGVDIETWNVLADFGNERRNQAIADGLTPRQARRIGAGHSR